MAVVLIELLAPRCVVGRPSIAPELLPEELLVWLAASVVSAICLLLMVFFVHSSFVFPHFIIATAWQPASSPIRAYAHILFVHNNSSEAASMRLFGMRTSFLGDKLGCPEKLPTLTGYRFCSRVRSLRY